MGDNDDDKWSKRRLRHCKQYGIKSDVAINKLRSSPPTTNGDATTTADDHVETVLSAHTALSRTRSLDHTFSRRRDELIPCEKRETVFQMACKGINSVLNGSIFRHIQNGSAASGGDRRRTHDAHAGTATAAAAVCRVPTYISIRDKDRNFCSSFPRSCHNGSGGGAATVSRRESSSRHHQQSTTFYRDLPYVSVATNGDTTGGVGGEQTNLYTTYQEQTQNLTLDDDAMFDVLFFEQEPQTSKGTDSTYSQFDADDSIQPSAEIARTQKDTSKINTPQKLDTMFKRLLDQFGPNRDESIRRFRSFAKFNFSIRRDPNYEQRSRSMPMFGQFVSNPELVKKLADDSCDYRPYFTYWISTVHVLVLLCMMLAYGIGTDLSNALYNPFGVIERSGDVMTSSLSAAHIVVWEQNNIWIGPKFTDLVHAGAKYTPCMRRDEKIYEQILQERRTEADTTGCCIGPWGCFQTSECPKQFAKLHRWVNGTFSESDYSRVVCGQDPRYCLRPRSVHPFLWGLNISKWPICEKRAPAIPKSEQHMHCAVTGRPCCIQMHGQCRITSREYCDFVKGYYHADATLCSQVSCLNKVCGMTTFLRTDYPDQIYRLITPLFIHAGLIRCAISLSLYLSIMRRFEIMIGWLRLSTIYFVSGIGGYLASAVFVPYMPEVGPAGSEGGILGALIINILYNWDLLKKPFHALIFHLAIAAMLFVLGFLPWIDNWAQVFGFVFGCLMATAVIPYFTLNRGRVHKRLPIVVGSLGITALLFVILLTMFFAHPINYAPLGLLNCPIPSRVCDQQQLRLRNWLPI